MGLAAPGDGILRLAIIGGASVRPLADLVVHFVEVLGEVSVELWTGEYDNYVSEILEADSALYEFGPQLIFLIPSEARCRYEGSALDPIEIQRDAVASTAQEILDLCETAHARSGAEVILANFRLPAGFDPGPMRSSSLSSDYAFRRAVNTELGLRAPVYVYICDVEFLANRIGALKSHDPRTWFESKQPYSADLLVYVAKEVSQIFMRTRTAAKKLIVLDLDNTLWGGVVGDDGLEGIEIGTTSPRGEAFRDFQLFLKSIKARGILLAVASKNDYEKAIEPFLSHPEMVLSLEDFVSFKANWEPKSENIREIATELALGLDSFVFVDDNPAEIEIVRQFVPEVTGICVGTDPSTFKSVLQDSRLFEARSVTREDMERSALYQVEAKRQALKGHATDMDSYLTSLEMVACVSSFNLLDAPRITQLINKSNQFNLTTRRRTDAETLEVMNDPKMVHFTVRLSDRFGEHGLIAVVIGKVEGVDLRIDTWLMSCRVLKRQVEEETLNQIVLRAASRSCHRIVGEYFPTAKNGMVAELYPKLGFETIAQSDVGSTFELSLEKYEAKPTKIAVQGATIDRVGNL